MLKDGIIMSKNFIDTIYLFSCGAKGIEPQTDCHALNYKEIYKIAKEQEVWETVFLSYIKLYDKNPDIIPQKTFEYLNNEFVSRCGIEYRRYGFIHNMLKKLESEGIECCILKGESIARFYNTPIARVSGDVDILINPKKLDLCLDLMKDMGFEIGEKVYESHQVVCRHQIAGIVEVHTMMYGKRTEDVCFNNEIKYNEEYQRIEAEDGTTYKTLGITDNFLFLFLHFVKHFLSCGVGMRQLEDLLIYTEKNYEKIDWDRVNRSFENLGFDSFFKCMIAIGNKYFDFPENLFGDYEVDEALAERVFEDMMQGGVFGHNDSERDGFYEIYLKMRYKKMQNKDYEDYKNKRKLTRIFPDRKFLSIRFPYVKKSPVLVPVAWVHRIILGLFKSNKNSDANKEMNVAQEERLELIKELGML